MVIKTTPCVFSEGRIYPGNGMLFVTRGGVACNFISAKCASLHRQRKKPAKLTWTYAWRRANKKGRSDDSGKAKKRRVYKAQRAVGTLSVDDLKKKRSEKPAVRAAAREAALREAKKRAGKGGKRGKK